MAEPTDFFTTGSLMTFSGATLATFIVPNALQRAFQINPSWLGLVVAEALCITIAAVGHGSNDPGIAKYIVAIINGCLVYCSALGATSIGAVATGESQSQKVVRPRRTGVRSSPGAVATSPISGSKAANRPPVRKESASVKSSPNVPKATPAPIPKLDASAAPSSAPPGAFRRSFFTPWI